MKAYPILDHNLSRLWAQALIGGLLNKGVRHFYVSPGMRNAPLIAAINHFKNHDPDIFLDSGFDERAQSFRALGRVRASEFPVVLVCTSGSALAHYAPAVVEAYKSGLPLIILSSDRPVELALSDANQTTLQNDFYGKHVRYSASLEGPNPLIAPEIILSLAAELVDKSIHPSPGPVHLNVPFREPLDSEDDTSSWPRQDGKKIFAKTLSTLLCQKSFTTQYNDQSPSQLTVELNLLSPVLVVVGELTTYTQRESVRQLLQEFQELAFILDISSGIKYEFALKDGALPSPDHPEVYKSLEQSPPKTLIHIGGRTTSKHYYRLQREWGETRVVFFSPSQLLHDPAHRRGVKIQGPLEKNLPLLAEKLKEAQSSSMKSSYTDFVQRKSTFIDQAPLAYPSLSKSMIEMTPRGHTLFLGNSTVIRSFDSYASPQFTTTLPCFVQRGASGIEGLLSEAIGLHDQLGGPIITILGDISLMHDLNALITLQASKANMLVVVVNNGGGGIFHLLPAGNDPLIEKDLFTPHQVCFTSVAQALGLQAKKVDDVGEFRELYQEWTRQEKFNAPRLIEAVVDDQVNCEIYRELKTIKL